MDGAGLTPMTLAKAALGVCALGLLGLMLPFVDAPLGFGGSLFSLSPGLAVLLLLLFLGLTALPVIDVRGGTLRLTPWLAVPGMVGVLGSFVVWILFQSAAASGGLAGLALSTGFISLGTGFVLMTLASVGLIVVGIYGFVLQNRIRSPWARGGGFAPGRPPYGSMNQARLPPQWPTPPPSAPQWPAHPPTGQQFRGPVPPRRRTGGTGPLVGGPLGAGQVGVNPRAPPLVAAQDERAAAADHAVGHSADTVTLGVRSADPVVANVDRDMVAVLGHRDPDSVRSAVLARIRECLADDEVDRGIVVWRARGRDCHGDGQRDPRRHLSDRGLEPVAQQGARSQPVGEVAELVECPSDVAPGILEERGGPLEGRRRGPAGRGRA